jgi:hypothetical protein
MGSCSTLSSSIEGSCDDWGNRKETFDGAASLFLTPECRSIITESETLRRLPGMIHHPKVLTWQHLLESAIIKEERTKTT